MRLKLIKWLIIPILSIFLMSYNTFAADINLNSYLIGSYNGTVQFCTDYVNDSTATKHSYCYSGGNKYWTTTGSNRLENLNKFNFSIAGIKLTPSATINAGRLVVAEFYLNNMNINDSQDTNMVGLRGYDNRIDVISTTFSNLDNNTAKFDVIFRVKETFTSSQSIFFASSAAPASLVNDSTLMGYNFLWLRGQANAGIMGGHYSVYSLQTGFDDTDIINAVNNLEQTMGGMSNNIQTLSDNAEAEQQAVDNISNQTPPASGSGQNSTTSSLLDTLGGFLTAITNLSATNCNVVLAFPSFAGGSQTVNICQNKEYTGNIVSIAGSIILVLFYLPVAFMLINKIYSEIRSFTNG